MKCRITNVLVHEIHYNEIAPPRLLVRYALVDERGSSFGQGTRNVNFSDQTLELLERLQASLALDVMKDLFAPDVEEQGTGEEPTTASGPSTVAHPVDEIPGL